MNCPCNSNNPYSECCEIIHINHKSAGTAEQLMRARYSAFVLHQIDFIYNTFHPNTRRFQKKADIKQWAEENKWIQLDIIKSTKNTVEFKAHFLDANLQTEVHHEKSNFSLFQGTWYYVDGILMS